jgi:hypothetical protein
MRAPASIHHTFEVGFFAAAARIHDHVPPDCDADRKYSRHVQFDFGIEGIIEAGHFVTPIERGFAFDIQQQSCQLEKLFSQQIPQRAQRPISKGILDVMPVASHRRVLH